MARPVGTLRRIASHTLVMRSATTLVVAALVAASCTSSATTTTSTSTTTSVIPPQTLPIPVNARTLTEMYPCGWGFWLSNPDETVGLFIFATTPPFPEEPGVWAEDIWTGVLRLGTDLFANRCTGRRNQLLTGVVTAEWKVVAGTLEILTLPEGGRGPATAVASNIVVESPDGSSRVTLGHFDLTNPRWGILAR